MNYIDALALGLVHSEVEPMNYMDALALWLVHSEVDPVRRNAVKGYFDRIARTLGEQRAARMAVKLYLSDAERAELHNITSTHN